MGKIKAWYRSIPLWLAIFLFAAAALITASFVSNKITTAANNANYKLLLNYIAEARSDLDSENTDIGSFQINDDQSYIIDIAISDGISNNRLMTPDNFSDDDLRLYNVGKFVSRFAPLFVYSLCLLLAVLLIYFTKLKKPLTLLLNASAKIAENEFDFSLDYSGRDEMAKLCGAFEKMRSALDESNRRMNQMIEERTQLNDAYTHDIRTPIAVLKGYTGILSKFLPTGQFSQERVIATVNTMEAHVERLEQFANSMNTAQKLADVAVKREQISTEEFVNSLQETAAILCENKHLSCRFESCIEANTLYIDPSTVTQVFDNLLSNATRFANTEVTVLLESDEKTFRICVTDDGKGFTEKALSNGTQPYFSGEQIEETYHFGLGLYICKTLCEKHGGSLKLANAADGGASVTSSFAL